MTAEKKLTQLEKLDARIEAMRQKRALIVSRESNEQRKLRSRKCAILGAWLMAKSLRQWRALWASSAGRKMLLCLQDLSPYRPPAARRLTLKPWLRLSRPAWLI